MKYAIIAAGEGSRLAAEGIATPKPMVPLGGEPMLGRLVRIFLQQGAEEVCLITNPEGQETVRYVQGQLQTSWRDKVRVLLKATPSSMHSFHELSPWLRGGPFCLTTVDTIFLEKDFSRFVWAFLQSEVDGMMGVTDFVDDEKPLYVATAAPDNQRITGFHDTPTPDTRHISGGIYALKPVALDVLDKCMEQGLSRMRNFQRALVAFGLRLEAYPFGTILDVDHAADIEKANNFLEQHSERHA